MDNISGFLSDATFLADVYSAFGVADNMRQEKDGLMAGLHEDGDRGRKRPESDDDDDEDGVNKHLRMMSADEQRRYLRENHSQIEKRRRDKMNTHIKELCNIIPACKQMSRKTDKLTILRLAVQHMKTIRGSLDSYTEGNYKPPMLTDKELKQLIIPSSDGFMFVVDTARGRLLFVSESVRDTLNFTSQDLTGQSLFDILHPKDISKVKEQLTNIDSTPRERLIDSKTMLPLRGGDVTTVARFHPGARRLFFCRMKCKPSAVSSSPPTPAPAPAPGTVKQEDESQTSGSSPMMTASSFASSSSTSDTGRLAGQGGGKKKKSGVDRKYLSIQCTGYLKSWPCTKVGLPTDFSDQDSVDESSMSCLVAVARVQPAFTASIEDCVERGQRTAHGVEFTSRHGTDGKFSYVDQRVTLILGYTPQELLGTSLYEHIQFDDIPAISECHRNVLKKPDELSTPFYRFRAKDGTFVKLESKWKQFRNPWTKEIEYLISKNYLLISDEKIVPQLEAGSGASYVDSGDLNFFSKSGSSSAENSNRSSPQGREIQRVISNYADAAKIGRKIADEAREKSRADDSSASNSPMSVSAPSPQSYLQRNVSEPDGSNSTRHDRVMANAIAEVEQDRSKLSGAGVIVSGKNPVTCPTAATTSRGGLGRGAVAAAVSLSEQILQGAANAKRHSPQSSSASSEGNDDAAMAVIMSLLEADAGLGGPVDFSGLPWPLP